MLTGPFLLILAVGVRLPRSSRALPLAHLCISLISLARHLLHHVREA